LTCKFRLFLNPFEMLKLSFNSPFRSDQSVNPFPPRCVTSFMNVTLVFILIYPLQMVRFFGRCRCFWSVTGKMTSLRIKLTKGAVWQCWLIYLNVIVYCGNGPIYSGQILLNRYDSFHWFPIDGAVFTECNND
jgi:hypothetical protein